MSILKQKTLKREISLSGVGLHSGNVVNIKLVPQKPNTGIYFKRIDLKSNNIIYPSVFYVSSASYCTKISNEYGVSVSTIEHLMAALYGKGVDNLLIEMDSEEVPILDGSSKNFVEAIDSADLEISDQPIKIITIDKEVNYKEGEKNGEWLNYYDNGQLKEKGNHKDGWEDGLWEYFIKDGSLKRTETWKDGEKID